MFRPVNGHNVIVTEVNRATFEWRCQCGVSYIGGYDLTSNYLAWRDSDIHLHEVVLQAIIEGFENLQEVLS